MQYFAENNAVQQSDWDTWLHAPGVMVCSMHAICQAALRGFFTTGGGSTPASGTWCLKLLSPFINATWHRVQNRSACSHGHNHIMQSQLECARFRLHETHFS